MEMTIIYVKVLLWACYILIALISKIKSSKKSKKPNELEKSTAAEETLQGVKFRVAAPGGWGGRWCSARASENAQRLLSALLSIYTFSITPTTWSKTCETLMLSIYTFSITPTTWSKTCETLMLRKKTRDGWGRGFPGLMRVSRGESPSPGYTFRSPPYSTPQSLFRSWTKRISEQLALKRSRSAF